MFQNNDNPRQAVVSINHAEGKACRVHIPSVMNPQEHEELLLLLYNKKYYILDDGYMDFLLDVFLTFKRTKHFRNYLRGISSNMFPIKLAKNKSFAVPEYFLGYFSDKNKMILKNLGEYGVLVPFSDQENIDNYRKLPFVEPFKQELEKKKNKK